MIKIAICEDDAVHQKMIENQIIESKLIEPYELKIFDSGEDLVKAYEEGTEFQIIFLDMKMERLNGIQTAEIIRKYDKRCLIIIITSLIEYAVDGYSVNAYEFILKPIDEGKFEKVITSAVKKLKEDKNSLYVIETREKTLILKLLDIVYIESNKKKIKIHSVQETYSNNENITEAEEKLADNGFLRISRFYLVNMRYIKDLKVNCITLTTGVMLNYSEKYQLEIKQKYMDFMMGGI